MARSVIRPSGGNEEGEYLVGATDVVSSLIIPNVVPNIH